MSADQVAELRERLPTFQAEATGALLDLAAMLGVDPPRMLLEDPAQGLPRVERLLRDEDLTTLSEDEHICLAGRLMSFIGALLKAAHDGEWTVDDDPSSPSYAHYVVAAGDEVFDVSAALQAYLDDRPPRSLVRRIAEIEAASELS